jgi:DNA primase
MARIAEAELERIKREVAVAALAERRGVELSRHGADLIGLCPFHDDREPSLVVSPAKNLWHCLGACGAGGSVIDWVMRSEGVSFRHAVEILRVGLDGVSLSTSAPAKRSLVPRLEAPVDRDASEAELLGQVVGYYHERLKVTPAALEYLQGRGLSHPEMVERFALGFADRTLGLRLPGKRTREGEEVRGRLQRLGLFRASGHEHFNGCLTIPIHDEGGKVVSLYGRKVGAHLRPGTPLHLYLPGPHRGVWNLDGFAKTGEVIVCEALLDALTFWCAGFRNVTASYGVHGFTDEHLAAFRRCGIERAILAYDRDEAGDQAASSLAARLSAEGIACYRALFPRGMDANEYAAKMGPPSKSLELVLRQASWLAGPERLRVAVAAAPTSMSTPAKASQPEPPPIPLEEPPATPTPPLAAPVAAEVSEREVRVAFGERRWRVRGLDKNLSFDLLRVNLLVACGEAFHVDTIDLYTAKQRQAFGRQAAEALGAPAEAVEHDLGRLLLELEQLQAARIEGRLAPRPTSPAMSAAERAEALRLLRDPQLVERVLEAFERWGLVGEASNKLVAYLAATSRKLASPIAVVIQSSSAAGKTTLMEAALALVPEEERVSFSAMTGQSLYYMGEHDLAHKVLAIVEEEGAERASYALKLLQSEGKLSIASTGKDPKTGRLVTQEYRVEGPVSILLTTTAVDLDEELLNRCLVLTVDEGREQTRAIHERQRTKRTLAGLLAASERDSLLALHRNAQRLLRSLAVVNPYAPQLTFASDRTRSRRDHEKYLTLIDTIALLHQYQRPVESVSHHGKTIEYVEVELADIELANRLAGEVLGRSLDELPPQTRRFLERLHACVEGACAEGGQKREEYLFSARWAREGLGLSATQVKVHLRRLVELEYVLVHRARRGQGFLYELVYAGEGEGRPFLPGLIDVAALRKDDYDAERSAVRGRWTASERQRSGAGRWPVGVRSVGSRSAEGLARANGHNGFDRFASSEHEGEASQDDTAESYVVEPTEAEALS